ncbi:uncharacterized protein K489DRAFT_392436 [Dissoconium aciculare CBS 342.82]|uniref:Uncharacterized protein n=1 Tax=Dissoconium aciculare CBS 342.82 TaxID=1314786 RepID=A0A6J3MEQ5_9PEZI|nr:uncharacterized protein K489DRAFT_392436 [Dissoconium aciculare CBS 342.82]KAF1826099.1 hypothetical protein K489DRAFT_392436 [Dissoconium aciculare CBS 342.82]
MPSPPGINTRESLSENIQLQTQSPYHTAGFAPDPRSASPVAPEYSPITPKVQPVLPATAFIPPPENGGNFTFSMAESNGGDQHPKPIQAVLPAQPPAIPKAEYIPQPPTRPFSSADATDAMALRAAISTLQFQRQKAQNDMQELARIKQMALDDPERFKKELAAGRLKEERHTIGNMQSILDDLDNGDDDDEVVFELRSVNNKSEGGEQTSKTSAGMSDLQLPPQDGSLLPQDSVMADGSAAEKDASESKDASQPFPRIPGAQNVVRMPCVNWDKYGIVGEPLERMHNQQRRWPGTTGGSGQDRGREHAVAAPYSPFLDRIEPPPAPAAPGAESRKDSAAVSPTALRAQSGSS